MSYSTTPAPRCGLGKEQQVTQCSWVLGQLLCKGSQQRAPRSPICPPQGAVGKQMIPKALRGIFNPVFILQNRLNVGVSDDDIIQF